MPPEELVAGLRDALGAASPEDSQRIARARSLEIAQPTGGDAWRPSAAGPDADALGALASALREELATAKDRLDLLVRQDDPDSSDLNGIAEDLERFAQTLAVAGLTTPERVLREQAAALREQADRPGIDEGALLDIAAAVVEADDALPGSEYGPEGAAAPQAAAAREAREALGGAQRAIADFIATGGDRRSVEAVPEVLGRVQQVLEFAAFPRLAAVLASSRVYVEQRLLTGERLPATESLDALVDVLGGVDYYLERFLADRSLPDVRILERAEAGLAELDSPVVRSGSPAASVMPGTDDGFERPRAGPDDAAACPVTGGGDDDLAVGEGAAGEVGAAVEGAGDAHEAEGPDEAEAIEVAAALHPDDPREDDAGNRSADEPGATHADDFDLEEMFDGAAAEREPEATEAPASGFEAAPQAGTPSPREEAMAVAEDGGTASAASGVDDEIVEVFREELAEVLAEIDAHLPRWEAERDDHDALREIRRAFHTLKGSGRMVGAELLAELAWSVENCLNRVLDGTLEVSDTIRALVVRVRERLPGLDAAFVEGRTPAEPVEPLMELADVLASGGSAEDVGGIADLGGPAGAEERGAFPEQAAPPESADASERETPAETAEEASEDGAAAPEPEPHQDEPASGRVRPTEADFDLDALAPEEPGEEEQAPVLSSFGDEVREHLAVVEGYVERCRQAGPQPLDASLRHAAHSLAGSASVAGFPALTELFRSLDRAVHAHAELERPADERVAQLIERAHRAARAAVDEVLATGDEPDDERQVAMRAELRALDRELEAELEALHSRGSGRLLHELLRAADLDQVVDGPDLVARGGRAGRADGRLVVGAAHPCGAGGRGRRGGCRAARRRGGGRGRRPRAVVRPGRARGAGERPRALEGHDRRPGGRAGPAAGGRRGGGARALCIRRPVRRAPGGARSRAAARRAHRGR